MRHDRYHYWRLKLPAMLWLLLGFDNAACRSFGLMLRTWPDDAYALASRAHVLAQLGRREQAIVDAQRLTALYPARSAADWFNLAFLLEGAGRPGDAEPAFRRALELDPKLDRAWYGLALVLIRMDRGDEALAALKRNTELQPMSPYGWYQLARLHADRHDTEAARRIIRHLKDFEPQVAAQLQRETGLAP